MIKYIDRFLNNIDRFLNSITMYRLVIYCLAGFLAIAGILGFFGMLPYTSLDLFFSAAFILAVCWITNWIFASVFKAQVNSESAFISALILSLIIAPATSFHGLIFLGWASIWAMASKYIFSFNRKHIFNPAAFAVALTAITINQPANWWIGGLPMLPFVTVGGFLIARKIRKFDLVVSFLLVALASILTFSFFKGVNLVGVADKAIFYSPLLFFAFIMLTDPLTSPGTRILRIFYGALVGFLFAPQVHLGTVYFTPELALITGNVFTFLVSPKGKVILKLNKKLKISPDTYDFLFVPDRKISFSPGQYLELTLNHPHPDNRGSRRYFTIASSPTETGIRMGIKFYDRPSSFKRSLLSMGQNDEIIASQAAGDFVLPKDQGKKLVFMAGGIGITPFRSMVKCLLDIRQKRDITIFYSVKKESDIIYKDVFDQAKTELGIKTIYLLTESGSVSSDQSIRSGRIDSAFIKSKVPDFQERIFYLSGPRAMVIAFRQALTAMGIPTKNVMIDFFPGFA